MSPRIKGQGLDSRSTVYLDNGKYDVSDFLQEAIDTDTMVPHWNTDERGPFGHGISEGAQVIHRDGRPMTVVERFVSLGPVQNAAQVRDIEGNECMVDIADLQLDMRNAHNIEHCARACVQVMNKLHYDHTARKGVHEYVPPLYVYVDVETGPDTPARKQRVGICIGGVLFVDPAAQTLYDGEEMYLYPLREDDPSFNSTTLRAAINAWNEGIEMPGASLHPCIAVNAVLNALVKCCG